MFDLYKVFIPIFSNMYENSFKQNTCLLGIQAQNYMSLNKQIKQDIYINLTHVLMCSDWNNPVSF